MSTSSSARQLRESGEDREATLARIGSVQEELARMTDPQAAERDAGLSQLARSTSRGGDRRRGYESRRRPGGGRARPRRAGGACRAPSEAEAAERAAQLRSPRPIRRGHAAAGGPRADRGSRRAGAGGPDRQRGDRAGAQEALERAADAFRQSRARPPAASATCRAPSPALQEGARSFARAGQPTGNPQPGASGQPVPRANRARLGQPGASVPKPCVRAAGARPAGRHQANRAPRSAGASGQPGGRVNPLRWTAGEPARQAG